MAEVARNIDEATAKVKGFTQEIKSAETELRALDKALKVDPSNVDLVTQKYNTLANQLALNEEKAQALKDQIANLKAEWDNGDISQETYEKNLKKLEQQLVLTEIETTRLTASVSQQNEVMQNLSVDDFTSGLSKAEGVTTSLDTAEKKMTFSTLTKGLRDAKKEASNFMSAVGFLSSALSTSLNLINKWGEMDALTKILSTLSIVATVAAAAMTIFHASWSVGLAVGAIVAAIAVGVAAVKSASKEAGIDANKEIDNLNADMSVTSNAISTQRKEIDINVKLETSGDTMLDQTNAFMMGGIIVDKLKKDLVNVINNEMGGIVRS